MSAHPTPLPNLPNLLPFQRNPTPYPKVHAFTLPHPPSERKPGRRLLRGHRQVACVHHSTSSIHLISLVAHHPLHRVSLARPPHASRPRRRAIPNVRSRARAFLTVRSRWVVWECASRSACPETRIVVLIGELPGPRERSACALARAPRFCLARSAPRAANTRAADACENTWQQTPTARSALVAVRSGSLRTRFVFVVKWSGLAFLL